MEQPRIIASGVIPHHCKEAHCLRLITTNLTTVRRITPTATITTHLTWARHLILLPHHHRCRRPHRLHHRINMPQISVLLMDRAILANSRPIDNISNIHSNTRLERISKRGKWEEADLVQERMDMASMTRVQCCLLQPLTAGDRPLAHVDIHTIANQHTKSLIPPRLQSQTTIIEVVSVNTLTILRSTTRTTITVRADVLPPMVTDRAVMQMIEMGVV